MVWVCVNLGRVCESCLCAYVTRKGGHRRFSCVVFWVLSVSVVGWVGSEHKICGKVCRCACRLSCVCVGKERALRNINAPLAHQAPA